MAERTIATPGVPRTRPGREGTRARDRYLTPQVDIYETPQELVLLADLPGVNRDDLEVRVEDGVLTIQGRPRHGASGRVLYQEFELIPYFRQFELGEAIDQGRIAAELKHGVLTLHLPKVQPAQPRRIEVRGG
jgi:HSP20 family molecular chaperone IbpA